MIDLLHEVSLPYSVRVHNTMEKCDIPNETSDDSTDIF